MKARHYKKRTVSRQRPPFILHPLWARNRPNQTKNTFEFLLKAAAEIHYAILPFVVNDIII